ncbi:MAG: cytochrome ubiquinol oxidase subunit I [Candidatus Dormibacteraeota bacterium]|nr:cytochrome ubiquinol oxidase subunit I [Candidatus Dormibacteraeota bacterium]
MTAALLARGYSELQSLPDIHVPLIGNRWAVGIFFLVHIVFGSFTMGTIFLSPTYQLVGRRRADARFWRYARNLAEVNIRIFSIGATFAGFAVIFLTALYPRFFIPLIEMFFWPALIAFLAWIPAIAALYLYVHKWDSLGATHPHLHLALGYYAAGFEHLFLVMIVGIDSYLLTPGRGHGMSAFFNASYFPELLHRFVGNISWASFFIAGISAIRASSAREAVDRVYHAWATRVSMVVGFLTLVVQAVIGFFFAEAIRQASPGAFTYSVSGRFAWLWIVQGALLAVLLVGSNVYFQQTRPSASGRLITGAVVALSLVEVAPSAVYPRALFWVRYLVLGCTLVLSVAHFLAWRRGAAREDTEVGRAPRTTMAVVAFSALTIFLLMGIIRTTARGEFTVYGKQTESQSYGLYSPPAGHYP